MRKILRRGSRDISRSRGSASKRRKILEYLAVIAVKHSIEAKDLLNCILEAWNQQQSECNQLTVKCRERTGDSANFLFTVGSEVLAQFPIPIQVLRGSNELESYMDIVHIKPMSDEGMNYRIKDLKAGMRKVNLKASVLEIPEPNQVYTRHGTVASVTNVLIGDETGTIRMNLWNQQINMVSEGDLIQIDNGTVARFRGERQLRIGKHGKITIAQDGESPVG
jgi:replication factor A1